MKILVTGAAGFIGSDLAKYLLDKNYEVVGIDNFNDYYSPKIKEFNIQSFKENPKFKLYRVDISDRETLKRCLRKIQIWMLLYIWLLGRELPTL